MNDKEVVCVAGAIQNALEQLRKNRYARCAGAAQPVCRYYAEADSGFATACHGSISRLVCGGGALV